MLGPGLAVDIVAAVAACAIVLVATPVGISGVITFAILAASRAGAVAPDWRTGVALGVGGLAGAYFGARLHLRLPEQAIRRIVGILVAVIGARYLWSGLG